MRGTRGVRRAANTASCASDGHGGYAFDDNTAFQTNLSNAEYFGYTNLATANYSGTFEGADNTVCDDESVIAGGELNTIDGGDTGNPNVASASFIASGYLNTITAYDAFIGAGRSNDVGNRSSAPGTGIKSRQTMRLSAPGITMP